MSGHIISPASGFVWNPLRDTRKAYPNRPCICGSGKKIKKCCGFDDVIRPEWADCLTAMMNQDEEAFNKAYAKLKGLPYESPDTGSNGDGPTPLSGEGSSGPLGE